MASQFLMSEEDILNYFLQNNGIVRNTEIVTYFRFVLSDPNVRDEARVLFKSYVNKLANVKTENGEKFLVLKRQYFPPIDGRPSLSNYPPPQSHYQTSNNNNNNNNNPYGYPPSRPSGSVPSPYDSSYPPPPVQAHHHPLQRSLSQNQSQSQLYGSAFSLNSTMNYMDPYPTYNHPPPHPQPPNSNHYVVPTNNNNTPHMNYGMAPPSSSSTEYSMEYGLPPPPPNLISSPINKRFSSPPSNQTAVSVNSSSSLPPGRLPPPYRPPPPAARFSTASAVNVQQPPTTPPYAAHVNTGSILRHPANFQSGRYPSSPHNQTNFSSEPTTPTGPHIQFQRSLSVSGSLTSSSSGPQRQYEAGNYFDRNTSSSSLIPSASSLSGVAPPPPVPPRSKRSSFERSLTRSGSLASSSTNMDDNGRKEDEDDDESGGFITERSNSMGSMGNGTTVVVGGRVRGYSEGRDVNLYDSQEKENVQVNASNGNLGGAYGMDNGGGGDEGNDNENVANNNNGGSVNGKSSDVEQKISVKERLQAFNRIASESELTAGTTKMPSASRNRRDVASKHDSVDYDTASLSSFGFGFSSMQPRDKEWILKASHGDYHYLNKMAQENPSLVKRKDINGYTALHWASKHGNTDLVKLLAGTYKSNVNAKSNGGYTPLHLAAQFGRQEVYDILAQVYNADVNVRDHSGKKAMQYLVRADTRSGISMDTFKNLIKIYTSRSEESATYRDYSLELKEKRRSAEHRERESFLRIGSLNVRVKKTTEAFNNFLGKSTSSSSTSIERILHKNWGSADNIIPECDHNLENDKHLMPPPSNNSIPRGSSTKSGKRKSRRNNQMNDSTIKETRSNNNSDSDSAAGFGSDWLS